MLQGRLCAPVSLQRPKSHRLASTCTWQYVPVEHTRSKPGVQAKPRMPVARVALSQNSPQSPAMTDKAATDTAVSPSTTLLCVAITASSTTEALRQIREATEAQADSVELRLDFLEDFDANITLELLLGSCLLPAIVTYRAAWEGGKHKGMEDERLAVLRQAVQLGAAFVDVELKAADAFFAGLQKPKSSKTKVILSSHDYEGTPADEALNAKIQEMFAAGADIAKIATTAQDISDAIRMLRLPAKSEGPVISLAMGEKGLISRLLAGKFGGFLTFGRLPGGQGSAPGQPLLSELLGMYQVHSQKPDTKVLGVIGNPVSHSRSPALHNTALQAAGINTVYVPLLVDNLPAFLESCPDPAFAGFSVTIPHKVAALSCVSEADPVAARIGALNTLVRSEDGSLKGFNTDWSAAIGAIEQGLSEQQGTAGASSDHPSPSQSAAKQDAERVASNRAASSSAASPLSGLTVVVLGAGGAGRALAFGAADKGARVIISNRGLEKARSLAAAIGPDVRAVSSAEVISGSITGDVLINSTSVGMHPQEDVSPGPSSNLHTYRLVFDAVYTPIETKLLKEAAKAGCRTVSGLEMFIGQAAQQFQLFNSSQAPVELLRQAMLPFVAEK